MKKVLFIVSILFVAVVSTACINNFAVQDLNAKAKAYMEKGDYQQAIERLKSGIDLDPSVFETHYNLAVAYTMAEDYVNAVDEYKKEIQNYIKEFNCKDEKELENTFNEQYGSKPEKIIKENMLFRSVRKFIAKNVKES